MPCHVVCFWSYLFWLSCILGWLVACFSSPGHYLLHCVGLSCTVCVCVCACVCVRACWEEGGGICMCICDFVAVMFCNCVVLCIRMYMCVCVTPQAPKAKEGWMDKRGG